MKELSDYLSDVLGVRHFLQPFSSIDPGVETAFESPRVVFVLDRPLNSNTQAMLEKIQVALKLSAANFVVQEVSIFQRSPDDAVVWLGVFDDTFQSQQASEDFKTYGLDMLFAQPGLKREAWAVFQDAAQKVIKLA